MTGDGLLDVGEVVARTGVPVTTLHVWERRGLLRPVARAGLRRQYDPGVLSRIAAIVAFQRGGFKLAEIAELLEASGQHSQVLFGAKLRELETRRAQIDTAIDALEHALACPEPLPLECARFQAKAIGLLPAAKAQEPPPF